MAKSKTKFAVYNGLMIALVFLGTYLTRIPTPLPGGYFNLGDAVIMIAAILLGRTTGFTAGAVGSFLADMAAYGFLPFAPITFFVKGIEGFVTASIASWGAAEESGRLSGSGNIQGIACRNVLAVAVGAVIMAAGYFSAEAYILSIFNKNFGLTAAFGELVPNLIQGGLSAVVGYALSTLLLKLNIKKYI